MSRTDTQIAAGVVQPGCLLTREEACRRLGWQKAAWASARRDGLPCRLIGRRAYVLTDELIAWAASRKSN